MMTARQIRAARVLLGWTQETLAEEATEKNRVALTALKRLESERGLKVHETTQDRVVRTLKRHGVVFLNADGSVGVMLLQKPAEN